MKQLDKLKTALGSFVVAGIIASCGPTPDEIASAEQERAIAERKAENDRLNADRLQGALKLRDEVLNHKWDRLFEEKAGTPSDIEIDEKNGVSTSIGGATLDGTAMIDGVKHEFYLGFKRDKDGSLAQETFRVEKWEEYKPTPKGDLIGAWVAFQNAVEARLKSPTSAKFPFGGHRDVKHLGGGRYSVKSYVEAQNSFGATIRTNFSGTVANDGGGWKVISLTLEE